jgi:hypothetical protein
LPPSVLFLGRRVFYGVVVLLVPILRDGQTPERFRRLAGQLPVSWRTVQRWRRWWQEVLPQTRFWQGARAQLPLVCESALPGSLLEAFSVAAQGRDRALAALRWLSEGPANEHAR